MIICGFKKSDYDNIYCKIIVNLIYKNKQRDLWFLTEKENANFFSLDRCDGIIVMLLPELLLIGENIESNYPISEKLYYNLTKLIPLLVKQSKNRFHNIDIRCPLIDETYATSNMNATGMSFGIDSMYSFYSHYLEKFCPSSYIINMVTFFNHGALNGEYTKNEEEMRESFKRGRERAQEFANQVNVKFLSVDTNINEFYSLNYTRTHTYRTIGIVLCFQSLIKKYFYSSGVNDGEIKIDPFEDSAYYDLFSLPLLGTENIILYSDGYEKSRFEKTEFLTGIDKTKDVLSVCWRDIDNCSECPKCIRTLAALDLLEKLDEYSRVFDINKYRENKDWHWAKILSLSKTDPYYKELTTMAMEKNMVFSLKTRLLSMVFTFGRRVFNPNLLSRIQSIVRK